MTKTIVCGLDNSEAAGPVARVARDLAHVFKARVIAAHFDEESSTEPGKEMTALPPTVELQRHSGPPAEGLLGIAERHNAELLVVGARGRRLLGRSLLGSTSRRLIGEASCPVVLVPSETVTEWPGAPAGGASIVCGVDGSSHSVSAAQFAGNLATLLGCRLVVVHALQTIGAFISYPGARSSTPPVTGQPDRVRRQAEEVVAEAIGQQTADATAVIEPGEPAEVLQAVAERENAWLVVVAARGAGALRATLLGSTAMSAAMSSTRPVVVLSEAAEQAIARRGQTTTGESSTLV